MNREQMDVMALAEKELVQHLGESIGYGRTMQLCEQLWNEKMPGAAHSCGPCLACLVPCACVEAGEAATCDWCCGAGRVTKRVRAAQGTP